MTCRRARSMLYLYRAGELSDSESSELLGHLHTCESCRLEQERLAHVDAVVGRVRSYVPKIEHPETLVAAIVEEVRDRPLATDVEPFFGKVLNFFAQPGVRLASALCITIATSVFLLQYLTLFGELRSLEASARARAVASTHAESFYAVQSSQVTALARARDLEKIIPPDQYKIEHGQIVVAQSDVTSLLTSYGVQAITSYLASSVLRTDRVKVDAIIHEIAAHYVTVTDFRN